MKTFANDGSSCSRFTNALLLIRPIMDGLIDVAVHVRSGLPTQPSPKQSPSRRIVTASLLLEPDVTATFT